VGVVFASFHAKNENIILYVWRRSEAEQRKKLRADRPKELIAVLTHRANRRERTRIFFERTPMMNSWLEFTATQISSVFMDLQRRITLQYGTVSIFESHNAVF
jgi:hypothetical protein